MKENFDTFLAFVWPADGDFDSPKQGYHVTPGDSGGGTKGGVIEATWAACVVQGVVSGALADATDAQLATVLRVQAWGPVCDGLAAGVDLMVANGRMMSGGFPKLLQQVLGVKEDGVLGPITLAAANAREPKLLIINLFESHMRYLERLASWNEFGNGWRRRLTAAKAAAMALALKEPSQAVS